MYPQPPVRLLFARFCVAPAAAATAVVIFTFEVGTKADVTAEEAGDAN